MTRIASSPRGFATTRDGGADPSAPRRENQNQNRKEKEKETTTRRRSVRYPRAVYSRTVEAILILLRRLAVGDGDEHNLDRRDAGREHETLIVAVHHDGDADGSRGAPPRVLPHHAPSALLVLVLDLEHLGEVLPEAVRGGALDAATRRGDKRLHGGGVEATRELLLLGLDARDDGHGEEFLVDAAVELEDATHLAVRLSLVGEARVPLLPQKLARADERRGVLELPSHDVAPLVELQREVAVGPDPVGDHGVHHRLGRGTDRDGALEFRLPASRHPRHLGREIFDVILLRLQSRLGHEQREVAVLHPFLLDLRVEEILDLLPHGVRPGTQDVASGDVVVLDELAGDDNLRVPRPEVVVARRGETEASLLLRLARGILLLLLGGRLPPLTRGLGRVDHAAESVVFLLEREELGHLLLDFLVGGGRVPLLLRRLERGDDGTLRARGRIRRRDLLGGSLRRPHGHLLGRGARRARLTGSAGSAGSGSGPARGKLHLRRHGGLAHDAGDGGVGGDGLEIRHDVGHRSARLGVEGLGHGGVEGAHRADVGEGGGGVGGAGRVAELGVHRGERRGEIGHGGVEGGLVEPRAVVEHGGDDARGAAEGIAVEGEHVLGAEGNAGEGSDRLDGVVADHVRVARAHEHGGLVDRGGAEGGYARRSDASVRS